MNDINRAERVLRALAADAPEDRVQALVESPDLFDYVTMILDENAALRGRLGEVEATCADIERGYLDVADALLSRSAGPRDLVAEVRRLRTFAAERDVECAALRRMSETVDERVTTIINEECGMQPVTPVADLLTVLERDLFEKRLHIQSLELDNAGLALSVLRLDEMRKEHDMRCAVCFEAKGNDRHVAGCEVGAIRGRANRSPTVRRAASDDHDAE
jgi:hypothetical protein